MDGVPFRKLGSQHRLSASQVFRKVESEMDQLPDNSFVSKEFCNRWSGRLVIDGKYVAVAGYDKKIPFIYGIDFLTHDIPVGILAPSENEYAFNKFFNLIKTVQYPLQIVICDDIGALKPALSRIYPTVPIQLCHTHYFENLRQLLNIRVDEKYRPFFYDLKRGFNRFWHPRKRNAHLQWVYFKYAKYDERLQAILADINYRYKYLFAYTDRFMKHCPNTTNIIESFNSHLQGRLKSIKGFQTFHSAERFLNAWILRRRTKEFTDCD